VEKRIIVIGGSITGLVTALALARNGHRVTVLEKDPMPLPDTPDEAFDGWQRRGAPQVLQSHAFLARMHNLIRDREPELLQQLLDAGAEELPFSAQALQYLPDSKFEAADDDIVLLACRRVTFEWVLRRHVLATGLVEVRDGDEVVGLAARTDEETGHQRVTGVRLRGQSGDEQELVGDLVVDASGRRSKLVDWLPEIGVPAPREESKPCGIFYTTRFYRLLEGAERPSQDGLIGGDLGYLKFGIFPGDTRNFSITLAAAPDDDPMRAILRTEGFERVTKALPMLQPWLAVSEPVTEAHGMANLRNTRRYFVEDGEPLALGVLAIGDALIHANPLTGRGCSLAWMSAYVLADAVERNPDDLRALALDLESAVESSLEPWLRMQMRQDESAIEMNRALRRGEDPWQIERPDGTRDNRAYMRSVLREGLGPAMRSNLELMRKFSRVMHMLDTPQDLVSDPNVMKLVLEAYETRHERPSPVRGPSRDEMVELLAAA
jgi:2-polyprenyl-6-methoxyphenol hydroxylase-like FAD-dependent oxidoreductase